MRSSSVRSSLGPRRCVNIYCTSCESQVGIYDNGWERLTATYAIPKEKGTYFGTNVSDNRVTVPPGEAQNVAEGCLVSEASCSNCSKVMGQLCREAPDREKSHWVGQILYKLSKIYLKDVHTHKKVEPVLAYGGDLRRNEYSRSNHTAPPCSQSMPAPRSSLRTSAPRSSPYLRQTPRNDSYRGTRSSVDLPIDPRIMGDGPSDTLHLSDGRRGISSQRAPSRSPVEPKDTTTTLRRLAEQDAKISKIEESMRKLEHGFQGLKGAMRGLRTSFGTSMSTTNASQDNFIANFQSMLNAMKTTRTDTDDLAKLKAENQAMRQKLKSVAAAMGVAAADFIPMPTPTTTALEGRSVLGKRKRADGHQKGATSQNRNPRARLIGSQDGGDQDLSADVRDADSLEPASVEENEADVQDPSSTDALSKPPEALVDASTADPSGQVLTPPDSNLAEHVTLPGHGQNTNFAAEVAISALEDETAGANENNQNTTGTAIESTYPDFSNEEITFEPQPDLNFADGDDEDFDPLAEAKEKHQRERRRRTEGTSYDDEHTSLWALPKQRRKTTGGISAAITQDSLTPEPLPKRLPPPPPVLRGRRRGNLKYDPVALGLANFKGDKRSKAYHEARRRALERLTARGTPFVPKGGVDDEDESDDDSLDLEGVVQERNANEVERSSSRRQELIWKRDRMARETMEREELDGGH